MRDEGRCGACAEACPSGTLTIIGQYMTVEEVLKVVRKDAAVHHRCMHARILDPLDLKRNHAVVQQQDVAR